jgi:hypothetical protein
MLLSVLTVQRTTTANLPERTRKQTPARFHVIVHPALLTSMAQNGTVPWVLQ